MKERSHLVAQCQMWAVLSGPHSSRSIWLGRRRRAVSAPNTAREISSNEVSLGRAPALDYDVAGTAALPGTGAAAASGDEGAAALPD